MKNITEIGEKELYSLHDITAGIKDPEARSFYEFVRAEMVRRGYIIGISAPELFGSGSQDARRHFGDTEHHGNHHGRSRTLEARQLAHISPFDNGR